MEREEGKRGGDRKKEKKREGETLDRDGKERDGREGEEKGEVGFCPRCQFGFFGDFRS